jgi:two-component system CheB/CheR fusion protein
MLGVTIDITEDRRLRADLHERASALADADRRKDEFLAMLAHELRNPLAAVSTALHLLRADVPQRQRWLDMAGRQTKQLARLVDDLLDVSRITQGKITLRKERVVVGEVVARAVEMVHAEAEARAQRLTVEVGAEPVEVEADPVRLSQVVANLLSNAVKFTPRHGIIAVAVERGADAVAIRVRDSGVGLSTDLLPRIFDLFVQGEGSLDRRTGGLGIGLTVVRHVTEMHGGRVEARSDGPGRGSEFVVHLPLAATAARERPLDGRGAAGEPPRRLRVLVVEDNADTADGLATVLRLWGHEVRLAASGPAALESVEGATPDVILSDLGLPGMDGYRLARALRRDPACGKAALVALSGYGRDEDRRHAIEAGFDHHLVKPPDLDALAALLASVAERGDPPGTRR